MTVGSLFSGIGGFDLGFERAGFEIRWMCEIDPFCRAVLKRHWPEVPIFGDIKGLIEPERVDCLIGGFPCQDLSTLKQNAQGLNGQRSGLWWEMYRIICLVRPRYVAIENVVGLVNRGLSSVLRSLAQIGYDAEWQSVSAASVGAPHIRERIFIIAYPSDISVSETTTAVYRARVKGEEWKAPDCSAWGSEPEVYRALSDADVSRQVNGLPRWVVSNAVYGNAVVPDVGRYIANLIKAHERATQEAHAL